MLPARPLVWNWHLDAICEHLEAVSAGEIRRLVMNVPPRTMKSLSTSVFWPAWEWLRDPSVQWLYVSHSEGLALRDAKKARRLMATTGIFGKAEGTVLERVGYRGLLAALGQRWNFTEDENVMKRYSNDRMGYRISTGIGGGATGEGGDRVVIDDPHKLEEAESEAHREAAVEFVAEVVPSRLNSADSATVVIMQRVHEADVTGALLEEDGWTHLCLPMEYEPVHPFVWPDDPRTEAGELLFPDRFDEDRVEELHSLGSYKYAGQYQQRPSPAEGGILERGWWRLYEPYDWPEIKRVAQSWDMSFKDTKGTSYVVGQVWATDLADRYLLAQIRARLSFTATIRAVEALTEWVSEHGFGTHRKWVEDKANGPAVIDALQRKIDGLIPVTPEGSKEARAHAISPQVESGNVWLPRGVIPAPAAPKQRGRDLWRPTSTDVLVEEAATFPNGANDDQVDALTQALSKLGTHKPGRLARAV